MAATSESSNDKWKAKRGDGKIVYLSSLNWLNAAATGAEFRSEVVVKRQTTFLICVTNTDLLGGMAKQKHPTRKDRVGCLGF